jgi:hypothetical protein
MAPLSPSRTDARAAKAGAHVIEVAAIPMIRGVTLTTTTSFVKNHTEDMRQMTKGLVDAIHFFLTRKQETLEIPQRTRHTDSEASIG